MQYLQRATLAEKEVNTLKEQLSTNTTTNSNDDTPCLVETNTESDNNGNQVESISVTPTTTASSFTSTTLTTDNSKSTATESLFTTTVNNSTTTTAATTETINSNFSDTSISSAILRNNHSICGNNLTGYSIGDISSATKFVGASTTDLTAIHQNGENILATTPSPSPPHSEGNSSPLLAANRSSPNGCLSSKLFFNHAQQVMMMEAAAAAAAAASAATLHQQNPLQFPPMRVTSPMLPQDEMTVEEDDEQELELEKEHETTRSNADSLKVLLNNSDTEHDVEGVDESAVGSKSALTTEAADLQQETADINHCDSVADKEDEDRTDKPPTISSNSNSKNNNNNNSGINSCDSVSKNNSNSAMMSTNQNCTEMDDEDDDIDGKANCIEQNSSVEKHDAQLFSSNPQKTISYTEELLAAKEKEVSSNNTGNYLFSYNFIVFMYYLIFIKYFQLDSLNCLRLLRLFVALSSSRLSYVKN